MNKNQKPDLYKLSENDYFILISDSIEKILNRANKTFTCNKS
jgi:hypothetical protein